MGTIPPITKNLLIINILAFASTYVAGLYGIDLTDLLGLHFFLASDFRIYQLFTYMFMHAGLEHLFFNMFAVWMFGRIIEQTFGVRKYLIYYFVCGIGAGLLQEIVQYVSYVSQGYSDYSQISVAGITMEMSDFLNRWTTVGASGAVYGILLAFGMTYPEERMFIFPLPVPIKAKYFVMGYAIIELLSALGRSGDGVAHFAHLGGMLFGLFLILYWRNGGFPGAKWWKSLFPKPGPKMHIRMGGKHADDMQYNRTERDRSAEIDRILEKVKAHGYGSLSEEEKRKLFDASGR